MGADLARLLVLGLGLALTVLGLSLVGSGIACNTFEGAGKDVERTGEKMQDAADDARH